MNRFPCMLAACLALGAVSCEDRAASPDPLDSGKFSQPDNRQVFTVTGVVVQMDPGKKEARIKHDEIPGYMPAMTMPFDVKDTNELAGLAPGDKITFRLTVTDTEGWIDQVHKTAAGPGSPPQPPPAGVSDDLLEVGDLLPDYVLTNQFGEMFHTESLRGRPVALTFIFTRCPYPTFCLRMSSNFEAVQSTLKAMTNAPANWLLLSVTIDPAFDTPAVLKRYAETYHYDPAHWTFATGSLPDVASLAGGFGLIFWRDDRGSISHNLRTVVMDPAGRVTRIFDGNNWKAQELAEEIQKVADPVRTQKRADR